MISCNDVRRNECKKQNRRRLCVYGINEEKKKKTKKLPALKHQQHTNDATLI